MSEHKSKVPEFRNPQQFIANMLSLHRLCGHAHCRRARECCVEGEPCFEEFWPQVPEDIKVSIRTMITTRCNGASVADAMAAGEKAARDYLAMQERFATMAEQRAQPAQPPRREAPQPRVRIG